ncbi:MAG: hypothetical protein MPF33_07900 [Candidatus Aramenus sp.]|jgi:hypothetical protein|nr:hypothetical protein [Candidatus Aramenus sp.]
MLSLDPIQIAKMPYTQRNDTIMKVLNTLFTLDDNQKLEAVKGLLTALGAKASDEDYANWCDSMMRVLSMYPDEVVKAVLSLRAKAVQSLPKEVQERDAKVVGQVINSLDASVREKLARNMK